MAWVMAFLFVSPNGLIAAEPFHVPNSNPIKAPWRISRFPELNGRGLRCTAQDKSGSMWFGLRDGLVSYDGLRWKSYGPDDGLSGSAVESIVVRSDGTIVAASQEGLYQLVGERWLKSFPRDAKSKFPITKVMEDRDDGLWACSPWGLLRLQNEESTLFTSPDYQPAMSREPLFDSVESLPDRCFPTLNWPSGTGVAIFNDKVVLLANDSPAKAAGLRIGDSIIPLQNSERERFNLLRDHRVGESIDLTVARRDTGERETIRFTTKDVDGEIRFPMINSVIQDRTGRIWVGASKSRIFASDDQGKNWMNWSRSDGLVVGARPSIAEISDGEIWVVSSRNRGGLCRFDGETWSYESLVQLTDEDCVPDITETSDGTVWITGLKSMHLWLNNAWAKYYTDTLNIPNSDIGLFVAADDSLWISGRDQDVARIAISNSEYTSFKDLEYHCSESSGVLWFVQVANNRVVRLDGSEAISFGLEDSVIDTPVRIRNGPESTIVVYGSHQGAASVSVFDGTDWTRNDFPDLASGFSRNAFTVTSDGRILISSRRGNSEDHIGGLAVGSGDQWEHLKPPVVPKHSAAIVELPDGTLVFAGGFGTITYDRDWNRMPDDSLANTACSFSLKDSTGTPWMVTRTHGLFRFLDNQWCALNENGGLPLDGVLSLDCEPGGDVWAGTNEGIYRFDGSRFQAIASPRSLGPRSLRVGSNNDIWLQGSHRISIDSEPPLAILDKVPTQLDVGSSALVTWYGADAWNRTPPDELRWSYRVDDEAWSAFGAQRQLVLENMSAGRHHVQIRARDQSSNISETVRSREIVVLPPLWLRPWFLLLSGVILLLIGWETALVVMRGIRLRRSNRELETAKAQLAGRFAEQTARFQAVCDCSRIGIFVTNTDGEVEYANHSLKQLCGIPVESGPLQDWAQLIHPDDRDRILKSWKSAFAELKPFECTGRFLAGDGGVIWFEMVADQVVSEGQFLGYMSAVEDVTRRVQDSEELKAGNAKLHEAIEQLKEAKDQAVKRARLSALGQMAAGVAHDINNSLAPLLTYAELISKDEGISESSSKWIELIRLGVSDTAETIRRLDHFYRESHDRDFLKPVDLAETVYQAVELTRPRWQGNATTERKTVDISVKTMANPTIFGNASQIRSVLTNLIFNAVDAINDQGNVIIRVDRSDENAIIEVADDGAGMTSQQLDSCMEPFFTTKANGSGMGLAECEGVVRQHGGRMDITSEQGNGTEITLVFPLASRFTNPVDRGEKETKATQPSDGDPPDDANVPTTAAAVLYIDDDPSVRMSIAAMMQSLGIHVETAEDGPAGLERMQHRVFQLVICDQGLPGMGGLEVLEEIRRRSPGTPVVMISGWSLPEIRDGEKPDAFLEKPVAYDDMLGVLQQYLRLPSITSRK